MAKVKRALLSAYDKAGIVELGRELQELGVEIVSTGGTAHALREAGVPVIEVHDVTGSPEILDGRVKTLHPKIHGGILARRDREEDLSTLAREGIGPIDLVAVNLSPFERKPSLDMVDIGGPAMLRAAAKNWPGVVALTRPEDYGPVLAEIRELGGVRDTTRRRLAAIAFSRTAAYDLAVGAWLAATGPESAGLSLRYGENPHQKASFVPAGSFARALAAADVLGGKDLSYNNYLDLDAVLGLLLDLDRLFPTRAGAAIVKHTNPCGAAVGDDADAAEAFRRALAGDAEAAYGGILGISRAVTVEAAEAMAAPGVFLECVLAPSFEPGGLEVLTTRPKWGRSVRLVSVPWGRAEPLERLHVRSVRGGILCQEHDHNSLAEERFATRTLREPTPEEQTVLRIALAVVMALASNAIAVVKGGQLVGAGCGQQSRVDAVRIALRKAGDRASGAALASDAFFPFRDSVDLAAKAGIRSIVHPGGSKRDEEVASAADETVIAMFTTGFRHFRH